MTKAKNKRNKTRGRLINRLESAGLKNLKPGRHNDGNGLYLEVEQSGARRWTLRIAVCKKMRELGLGSLATRSLAEAREEAAKLRARARKGEDVLATRRAEREPQREGLTFEAAAALVEVEVIPTLKHRHSRETWLRSLEIHVFPTFGKKLVDQIDSNDVLTAIGPLWTAKPDVARKLFARIRHVIDWTTVKGYRNVTHGGMTFALQNPCSAVRSALPKKQPKGGHHESLPYQDVPKFLQAWQANERSAVVIKAALEFTILTAARTSETLEAAWTEIDFEKRTWSIPAERMKMEKPHVVSLAPRCIEILDGLKILTGSSKYVFAGATGGPLSPLAMLRALQLMPAYSKITVHGFRSAFKTWAEEVSGFGNLVIEASLAHAVQGIERHYLQTDFPVHRKKLMEAWARFVTAEPVSVSNVVTMVRA